MAITKSNLLTWYQKIFAVIAGASLVGIMWRARGSHGFGAKWGMFAVAFVFVLFVCSLYGKRKKMNYEMMPLAAVLAALTAGGWGTLNSQMNGYLSSNANFIGETEFRFIEISEYSGLVIMLVLGFGWLPLFAICLASLFSKKKYEFKDFLIFIGVYYVAMIIANFTISHYILGVINPEAVESCAEGLRDAGYDYTPMKAFIIKLGSASWAKKIPFCRNYFTSVQVISSAVGALTSLVSVAIVLKDKFTAVVAFFINLSCAVAITVADVTLILDSDRGFFAGVKTPSFLNGCEWPAWEFFTGFILGLLVMIVLVLLPRKYTESEEDYIYEPLIKNKRFSLIYNGVLTFFFSFVVILVRAFSFRLNESILDNEAFEIILTVVLSAALFYPVFKFIKKNVSETGLEKPWGLTPQEFAEKSLPVYVLVVFLVYFFLGAPDFSNFSLYAEMFSKNGVLSAWHAGMLFEPVIMIVSFIIFNISFKILKGKKQKN